MKEFNSKRESFQVHYSQITAEEREEIALKRAMKKSIRCIARELHRSPSTISREIRRNFCDTCYKALNAQKESNNRKRNAHKRQWLKCPKLCRAVINMLVDDGFSPETIAGRLRRLYPLDKSMWTNYESIYEWIRKCHPSLAEYLYRAKRKPKKRGKKNKERIKNRVSIEERPDIINERKRFGDWEVDLVVSGKCKAVFMVAVERRTRYYVVKKMRDAKALTMHKSLVKVLSNFEVHSITYDNGLENALHEETNKALGCVSYFCKPYSSWEKGSVENRNGALRHYFPKSTNFSSVTQGRIDECVAKINNKPMKCLGWQTPREALHSMSVALCV